MAETRVTHIYLVGVTGDIMIVLLILAIAFAIRLVRPSGQCSATRSTSSSLANDDQLACATAEVVGERRRRRQASLLDLSGRQWPFEEGVLVDVVVEC